MRGHLRNLVFLSAVCTPLLQSIASANPADHYSTDQPPAGRPELRATRLPQPPVIDGVLDDDAWRNQAPLATDGWRSYNPLHGDTIPQQTKVWAAYDADYLYFAFQCDDPEPSRIKT